MDAAGPSLIWIASHLRHPSGHAEEARSTLRALEQCGYEPCARELTRLEAARTTIPLSAEELAMLSRQLERVPSEPSVAIHGYAPKPERSYLVEATAQVARVMFETDRLPEGWVDMLREFEQVWVPSRHNHDVFAQGGVAEERLRVLGQTVDFDLYRPGAVEPLETGVPAEHLVFLSNFDFSERKGWRQLLLAWARAFERSDPVCLVLKTLSVARWDEDYVEARIAEFLRRELGGRQLAPIRILPIRLGTELVPRLYAAADAYVSPSRGEAWGRTYMEAMAMGLPTIASRYGGHLDFMSDDDCWLIDGGMVEVSERAEVLAEAYRGHRWFEADVDQLAAALREVAADPAAARAKASGTRQRLIAEFGHAQHSARIAALADEALAGAGQPSAT